MNLVFRVHYQTVPGQWLWLQLDVDGRVEWRRMEWLNLEQWQVRHEVPAASRIRYRYQLREDGSGVVLDEWGGWREVDRPDAACLLRHDTWRSAGTPDYLYETKAFRGRIPDCGPIEAPLPVAGANHTFLLHMAAVPPHLRVGLTGDAPQLGGWEKPLVMRQVARDKWQAHVSLPADREVEYKFGLVSPADGSVVEWEQGNNRRLGARAIGGAQHTHVHDEGYHRDPAAQPRGAGVAVPVFSLRSRESLGVGEFADLKALGDWARATGLGMIQILPVNDTTSSHDWRDSYPYSAVSVFALNPIYLRVDDLPYEMPLEFVEELQRERESLNRLEQIDHEAVMAAKWWLTRRIFDRHRSQIEKDPGLRAFLEAQRNWLLPYAAFCVLRDEFGTADFNRWGDWREFDRSRVEQMMEAGHTQRGAMLHHVWLQYELDRQLSEAAGHLHQLGVVLKGDLPIGIDPRSVDAWSAADLFHLDRQAGAPPDAFAEKGQNWGFPTYDWERMREDGYAWWRARFSYLERYFDAFRIDHILGFFRIWQVPVEQVEGIMGWFEPAQPVNVGEFLERGIPFDPDRYCRPFLTEAWVAGRFGPHAAEVRDRYLTGPRDGVFRLRDEVATQRRIVDLFAANVPEGDHEVEAWTAIRQGLLDAVTEVLFFEEPGSNGTRFHPRFFIQKTHSFEMLPEPVKERVDALYVDYFFKRQDFHWKARGYEKLPAMRRASSMLLCGEDLGMVPDCVPDVLRELGILSLEIQRMPKSAGAEFGDPAHAPYPSVVSPSTHDMATLREWWREDRGLTGRFAWLQLGEAHAPDELTGELVEKIIRRHAASPAMWAVVPLQDLLAMDERLRHPDPLQERINVPCIMPFNWCYRMHLTLDDLAAADDLNHRIRGIWIDSGRAITGDA